MQHGGASGRIIASNLTYSEEKVKEAEPGKRKRMSVNSQTVPSPLN